MLVLYKLTTEYIASIRKTSRAAKQDDCSRLLRLYYGYVNNKIPAFSSAILVLPLPDTNGVT